MAMVEVSLSCTPWPQVSCTRSKLMTHSSHAVLSAWMSDAAAKPVPPPALTISPAAMEEPGWLEPKSQLEHCLASRRSTQSLVSLQNNLLKRQI